MSWLMLVATILVLVRRMSFAEDAPAPADEKKAKALKDLLYAAEWACNHLLEQGYVVTDDLESLKELDRYFDDNVDEETHQPVPGTLFAERPIMVVLALGALLGEVLRKNYQGEWMLVTDESMDPAEAIMSSTMRMYNRLDCWPMERVGKRVYQGWENQIYHYACTMRRK